MRVIVVEERCWSALWGLSVASLVAFAVLWSGFLVVLVADKSFAVEVAWIVVRECTSSGLLQIFCRL